MAITLVELLSLRGIELAEKIDNGEVITSALVLKSITLLEMEISKVKGIGLKKTDNEKQRVEYEQKEDALYSRLGFLNSLYKRLLDEETGATATKPIWFIGGQYDREMT